ncbi:dihydroxyacetone kinase subunit DhaK [Notoacmeibacter sp. MSK16QG-6]|uniref:dihydroxyacetone kinase subunit DhaK n=1 Tax=Notoacmeibacter sp. MSK16QG-6 TaxID=2957982 RepID=UPI00209ECDB5|nr:dihydroxyacetone kinase subunit DhaK [Notoacmeibacter sp. MSK16QG-6]MCP1200623.1 dihydroxyacetone kinase subunit DhaK [Notoacmeibacter sp. MSK16QG-6]
MSYFMNRKDDIITEAVDGLIAASGGKLSRLDGYPHIRVVTRADWDKSKVALVSGGGSGHEPAHAGFVGEGMLTAAVCGDVFASPSVDAVLAAILTVTGPGGCLLVVKNYTGDRLNFGLAAERARAFGLSVEMVIVDDDIALPHLHNARGVAGTLFVHKIAGALAERGADLATVTAAARKVIDGTKTIGMSLDTCTVPGSPKENRIAEGMAELGLGIHGEPGVEQIQYESAHQAMAAIAAKLTDVMDDRPHVAILNNLGGTSGLEMSVLTNELRESPIGGRIQHIIGPAPVMTSLDMRGFSVSIYPADDEELALLAEAVPLAAWPALTELQPVRTLDLPDGLTPVPPMPSEHQPTRQFLTRCCEILIEAEADLNALDAKAGDGDTGSTLAHAAHALLDAMDRMPLADHTQLFRAIGLELSQTMGGSSGVLLAIFFAATGDGAASGMSMGEALSAGLARMQEIGGANLGDRTMVDALAPALAALPDGVGAGARAARKGADETAGMREAKAGRASYISAEQLEGHIDPGAEAVARLFEHIAAMEDSEQPQARMSAG